MITVLYCTENSLDQIYCSVLHWKFIWPDLLFCTVLDRQTDRQIFQLNYQNNSCSERSCYWLSWKDTWSFVSVLKYQLICIVIVWRDHQNEYPLLAKMVKTYAAFQPTSVSSERIFNKDKLIYTNRRKCILPERSEKLICLQEFYRNRDDDSRWRICSVCPTKCYVIVCPKHNQL